MSNYLQHSRTFTPTRAQFIIELLDICMSHPNRRNPHDGESCLYNDRNDRSRHCIMGEWFTRHMPDVNLESYEGTGAGSILRNYGMTDLAGLATLVQTHADNVVEGRAEPIKWKKLGREFLLVSLAEQKWAQ